LAGDPSFRELLARAREEALGAYAHQDVPFERLVETLQPGRDLGRSPLFQVMLVLQQDALPELKLPGLALRPQEVDSGTAKFELTLSLTDTAEGFAGTLQYNVELFDAATVERLTGHLRTLLEGALARPELRLSELPLLPEAERRQLLVEWSGTRETLGAPGCLHPLFEAWAARTPDAVAVVAGEHALTYRELNARANQLARHLRALGVGPDQRVGLCLERSVDALVGLLGILKAGGAYVPLDDTFPDERLRSILEDADARILVTAASLAGRFAGFSGTLVRLDAEREALAGLDAENLPCAASPENLVYAIFTSGSTGRPKGVGIEHRHLVNYVRSATQRLELPEGARFASVSTLAADLGHTSLFPSLCLGGTLLLVSREHASDPSALAGWFERHAVDCLKIVPSHLGALLASDAAARVLPRQRLILGGEATDPALIARVRELAPGCEIHNHYGPTETTVGVLTCHIARGRTFQAVPLGRPLAHVEVYVLDARMRPVPVGVPGELYIGGASVARGYLGRPDLTAERFIPSPFGSEPGGRLYRTGDRVRWWAEGVLEFLGRLDDQLKIRGFRIEPGEVEATLARHPAVRETVVLARESTSGEKRLVAYAVPQAGVSLLPGALRSFLEEKLPAYMVPAAFVVLEALPLTPNGKVDRAALPVPAGGQEEARSFVAPRTPVEEVLAGLWAQVLGVERVGVHDDFFALGGHSLLATRAISRIRSAFRLEVALRELFEAPTVAALARRLEALARAGAEWRRPPVLPEPRTAPLPLSFAQQRLWFLDQLQPGSAFYNVPAMVRMEGRLDAEVLERSLREVIRRHEVLRSTFHASPEGPVQVVSPTPEQVLARVDLRAVPAEAREDEVRRLALAEATRPFDLGRGPLVRCTLLWLDDTVHVVLLTLHHIVSDGWSMGLLIREVGALYGAFLAGQPSPLPELPVQYADHAVWQRRWLRGEVLETQLAWWKRQLEGAPEVLELPADRPRPAVQSFRGALLGTHFSPRLAEEIRHLAEREGCTPFMVLMAAFQALLYRYTGQTDVLVGTDIANRHHAETEGLIGFFVNQLVLRGRPSGPLTFRELLGQVRETALGAYAHQDLPFEELVKVLNPERSLAHSPLFQVKLILQNARDVALELPGLTLRSEGGDSGSAKFDLTVVFTDSAEGLSCLCEYSTDLFDAGTVARLQGHLRSMLEGAVVAPEQRLSALPLLTEEERRQVLVEWNGLPGEVAPPGLCAHQLFAAQAARTPDAVALTFEGRQLTYAQLDRRANQLAWHLRALGVGPDVAVGLCLERSPEMVVGLLGILKAGAAWLPLDPGYPAERLSTMMGDAAVPVLVTQERLADELPSLGEQLVCLDSAAPALALLPETPPETGVGPDNLAYVIYTSGSTGRPKGALLTHRGLCNMSLLLARARGVGPGSRVLQLASPSFDVSVSEMFSALLSGARLCLASREALLPGPTLSALLREQAITTVAMPTSLLAQQDSSELPALETLIAGGDVCAPEVARRWSAGRRLLIEYGPTETTISATLNAQVEPERLTIGRPLPGVQVYLLDGVLQPVPVGVPGEVYLTGVGVGRGYLGRPDLTAERFLPVPFGGEPGARMYRTGDLARWRADGELVFVGRADQQVKVRGFRIELGEVEAALGEHPGVSEVVVVAREDVPGHKRLVAYLVAGEGQQLEPEALREFLKRKLPEYMVPSLFVELKALPLTPNQKVDRKALPAPEGEQVGRKGHFIEPRTSKERRLAAIWSQVLGVAQVGLHDNFFELGGDSIISLQVISLARQAGLLLSAKQVFEYQTLAELAGVLEEVEEGRRAVGEQGPVEGEVPLTPVQRWFFAQELPQPHHYNQAVLLEVRQPLEARLLEGALAALWVHHDALRTRFTRVDGRWEQRVAAPEPVSVLRRVDLSGLPEARHVAALEEVAAELHGGFNLSTGPLVKAALLERGEGRTGWLLLVLHHLVVDGVSWRVLLDDLEVAYRQLAAGTQVALPPKTASYKQWAERLLAFARSPALEQEVAYWEAQAGQRVAALPVDGPGGPNVRASARRVTVVLEEEETRALLQEVPTAWRARIDEVLLGALSLALARWTGERRLRVELEGHGREVPIEGLDVSRTVGWFTASYPVVLELPARLSPGDAVRAVRDTLRAVPHRGVGYGLLRYLRDDERAATLRAGQAAQVSFNYLGQFDATASASSLFGASPESSGPAQGEDGARTHLLEVGGLVLGGRLKLEWTYSENLHSRASLEALARECVSVLRALIARAEPADLLRYTPVDFPLAGLDPAALERVLPPGSPLEDLYPLSPMQEGMLFHAALSPRAGEYFEQVTCTFHVPLDVAAFRRAWREAVARHGILRTGFLWEGLEQPLQAVHASAELPWQELDWSAVPSGEHAARLEALLAEDRARGFELSRPPLMRLALIRLDARVHRLVWSFHHLLLDGWSVGLLLKEIFAFYGAFRQGRTLQPPRVPAYREYIAWLRRQDAPSAERYWRETLAGFTAPTPLPADKGSGRAEDSGKRTLHLELSAQETAALQEFARGHQLTLSTLVQGAWALLLGRYAGQEDVLFGATVSGRPPELAGSDAMVGLLINSLPVRVRLPRGERVVPWLRGLQARLAELRQYEASPLVRVQGWSEVPRGTPLFESLLAFENYPLDGSVWEGVEDLGVRDYQAVERTNFPLTLVITPGRGLLLKLTYAQARFEEASAGQVLEHLRTLLGSLIARPEAPLASVPLLKAEERRQVVVEWNQTAVAYPRERCLHELFEAHVDRTPDAIALEFEGRTFTYRELDARANQLAHALRRLGVGRDTRVGLLLERSPELVMGMLGILKAGGAYVPLETSMPAERLAYMLREAAVTVLLSSRRLAEGLPEHGATLLCLENDWELFSHEPDVRPVSGVSAGEPAYVMFTSGSTGRPKGVGVPHRGVVRLLVNNAYLGFFPTDRMGQACSVSFDASTFEVWGALLHGATLVGVPRDVLLSPSAMAAFIREQRVSVMLLPTAVFHVIAREHPSAFASMRALVTGGEAADTRWFREVLAHGAPGHLINAYGPTEGSVIATTFEAKSPPEGSVPIGRAISNTQVYLLDGGLEPVPVGGMGELYIGGDGLAVGYLRRPELTAERFIPDPFSGEPGARLYRTGDLARWLEDGNIQFLGRIDGQVKVRGFRIETGEVEAVLGAHPEVGELVVVAQGESGDKRLVAYVVPRPGSSPEVGQLRGFLKERLPEYMVPSAFVMLEALPLMPSGKVDRKALPAPRSVAGSELSGVEAPRTPIEELLAGMWAQVLGVERVGPYDSFFELGGHSLLATQVVSRIRSAFQVEVPLRDVCEAPTVAELAMRVEAALQRGQGPQVPPLQPVTREGELPLSFAQQRLWFVSRLEPGNAAYNILAVLHLEGTLDVPALEHGLAGIVRRHESLRTTFSSIEGRPLQVIAPSWAVTLEQVDLRSMPEAERLPEARRRVGEEGERPFDLERGPLLRALLVRLGEREHVLLLAMHHIVSDGWSMGVLVREMAALYGEATTRVDAGLAPLPVQYADYAAWQRGWLQGEALEAQLGYWRRQLEGAPRALELPTDRPRQRVLTSRGASLTMELGGELSAALEAFCRREGVTPFMALLAVLQVLLSRYSGQDDVCVGSPVAGRSRVETEGLVGFFVNMLVLRTRLAGNPTFRELLGRVRESTLGAYAHQDVPFEKLVEALQPERDLSRTPLFQVMLALQNAPLPELSLPGLTLRPLDLERQSSKFDLAFSFSEQERELRGKVEYNSDLFDAGTVSRMVSHLRTLLECALREPERRLADLPLLSGEEQRRMLVEWNDTHREPPSAPCAHRLFEAQVERTPDAPAVSFAGRTLTYRELDARANQLAWYLRERGVRPEVPVALCVERSLELVVGILGVLKAGGAYLPLDPSYPHERLTFMVEDARASLLLTQAHLAEQVPSSWEPCVLLDAGWEAVARHPRRPPDVEVSADSAAYIIYTSGSTGRPKGTVLTHRGLVNTALAAGEEHGVREDSRVLQFASMSFDASVCEVFSTLVAGACLCLARREELMPGESLTETLLKERISMVTLTPTVLAQQGVEGLEGVETVISAGEACTREVVGKWKVGRKLLNAYGPTEVTVCATINKEVEEQRAGVIGRPWRNVRVYVLDGALRPVPVGVAGELYVGGEGLARGYLGKAELTAEKFVPDALSGAKGARLYRTGDVVRWLPGGELEYVGRADAQVKVRGFRIELGEVEAVLRQQHGVADAVVVVREDVPGNMRLVAYVVGEGAGPEAAALRTSLRERLPEHMVPSAFVVLEALPLMPSGKVDRKALPAPDGTQPRAGETFAPPQSETERALASLWQEVLQVPKVGLHDRFFDLGGNSLTLVQLHSRMRSQLGIDVPLTELFQYPSIGALAAYLLQRTAAVATPEQADPERFDQRRARMEQQRRARRRTTEAEQENEDE
ncbi:non-ribosomal peptide synthetase, partial [Archangium sp.]|uniref:non-ribosomal peptide synthetase n=1 Tax=Archangium sp. TaxID=1872627 RepID=UPI002D7245F6